MTLTGFQTFRAAGLLEDQVLDVARDLHGAVDVGLSEQRESITTAIERLSALQGWLERIEYGARFDPVEIPLEVLFPPEPSSRSVTLP